ncbi:MAG: hypothetical protein D6728_10320 [Cyanobacteria bacterium J055]|nr:MAG: hypothetical protein D6728_10320 [Cyanobacteria bacterium J055]
MLMVMWRCFLSITILFLIVFPPSWMSSHLVAGAGGIPDSLSLRSHGERDCSKPMAFTARSDFEAVCLAANPVELPDSKSAETSENWLDFVSRKLRGLLWGMTRGIQNHPIKAWLSELEIHHLSRNEDVTLELEPNASV